MNHSVLLYGKPYSGKTTFAAQFPKPFIMSFDNNAQYILDKDGKQVFTDDNSYVIKDTDDFTKALNKAAKGGFETLIIDTIDMLDNMVRDYVLEQENLNEEGEAEFGRAWRLIRKMDEKLITQISHFKGNIIWIGWEQEKDIKDRLGRSTTHFEPKFNPKVMTHLTGLTSSIVHAKQIDRNGKQFYALSLGEDAPLEEGSSRLPIKKKLIPNDYKSFIDNFDM